MEAEHDPISHVKDTDHWEFLPSLRLDFHLPLLKKLEPGQTKFVGLEHGHAGPGVYFTKFMLLELIAALLCIVVFTSVARRLKRSVLPLGRFHNFFEGILLFIRDEVARPAIGHHHADHYLPYLWTAFFFILFSNLLGMLPSFGSPTGAIGCTGALALCTLSLGVVGGMREMGPIGYFKALVPHLDVPFVLKIILVPLMFVIELAGLLIKHVILSVRLFANMMAGHLVLAVILGFIVMEKIAYSGLIYLVAPASIFGVVALSLLELFVAFLQAYIFTFLSALFIGMAVHPEH
jgi:F-type H+-transporting ATPase subunit a